MAFVPSKRIRLRKMAYFFVFAGSTIKKKSFTPFQTFIS
jgi:hypothetical protein